MLSELIKMLREKKDFTPEELGRQVGVDGCTVESWERGESKPAFECILPLAKILDTTATNLLHADLPDNQAGFMMQVGPREWVSRKKTRNGTPYVHINHEPLGRARGLVAVGQNATGLIAIGGFAKGVLALGGLAVGVVSIGGGAVGLLCALGGGAIGLGVSAGGLAIGAAAFGGGAFGYLCSFGGNTGGLWLQR